MKLTETKNTESRTRIFFDWLDDKHLTIICILCFGILSLSLGAPGAVDLIEKLSYGLLGMAVGRKLK